MRSLSTDRMPLTPWRESIHHSVSSALTRMPNPLGKVTWQSRSFITEAYDAGYLDRRQGVFYLSARAVSLWFVVNPRHAVDPDADRRRDLVAYDEVLREFGPEIANTQARPPLHHRRHVDAAVASVLDSVGYETERRPA